LPKLNLKEFDLMNLGITIIRLLALIIGDNKYAFDSVVDK
jgi:hypothetical protein